jgi:dipeptidyl-peptidase 4
MMYPHRVPGPWRRSWALVALLLLGQAIHAAESTNSPLLTVDRIFESEEFRVESYGSIAWRQHAPGYYKLEKPEGGGPGQDLVCYDPETGQKKSIVPSRAFIPPGETAPISIEAYIFSGDESRLLIFTNGKRVWRHNSRGDYWVLDLTSREMRKLGGGAAPSSLCFAKFSPDATRVAYVREHNLYVEDLRDGRTTPLTTDGAPTLINGTFDWVYEEELDLRDGFRWSPDGRFIAYWQLDTAGVRDFYLINNTEGLYSRSIAIPYPKAGEQNSAARVGVVSAKGGDTHWVRLPGDPRQHYPAHVDWASNCTEIIVQQFNRLQNTNCVLLADASTGEARTILTETDDAWVENANSMRWIDRGTQFLWISDRDGWRQAYRVARDGSRLARITRGHFDLMGIEAIDDPNGWLYLSASPANAAQRYLYRVRLSGGKPQRLTPATQPGTHTYNISPDARWALHTYSTFTNPPVTELIRLPDHTVVRVLENNDKLQAKLATLVWPGCEFFRVPIERNVVLDGWCLKPPGFDPSRKYPVLFHVYGEPAGQTVQDAWRGAVQLWHWMLAQQGYVVLSVDNRGTPAPKGREWRKSIYRRVGTLNAADQAAAARALLSQHSYLDSERVGIWGWSGGGTSTLNAILQYPELYGTGMAVAAVPNLRFYDTIYQERYMGLPENNPEGYRLGSPISHASKLKGNLLIVHGTGDDNVHYQGAEVLINELIACRKPFSMMAYPNRSHGISEGRNTTRHLYDLLTRYLHEKMPTNAPATAPVAAR